MFAVCFFVIQAIILIVSTLLSKNNPRLETIFSSNPTLRISLLVYKVNFNAWVWVLIREFRIFPDLRENLGLQAVKLSSQAQVTDIFFEWVFCQKTACVHDTI